MERKQYSSWEESISFGACCDFFENLSKDIGGPNTGIKARRIRKLEKFLNQLRQIANAFEPKSSNADHASDKPTEERTTSCSLFPVIRLLLPQLDRERSAYGIKETLLAKLFIGLLQLGPNSEDAIKLKNYKAPKSYKGCTGDFASVLYSVVKDREFGRKDTCPNVADINTRLDEIPVISATKGRAGPEGVEGLLMSLFKRMNAIQVKWLVRIILKNMNIGVGEKAILNTFHLDAQELYDVNANLRKVAEVLCDPSIRRHEIDVTLFDPFRPMLAERGDADMEKVFAKQIGGTEFYIETKYDGERIQIHKDAKNNYRFFSRNGNDFTEDFGENPVSASDSGELKFCSFIHESLASNVSSVILDGEICAFNKLTESVTQKGEYMSIRGIRPEDPLYQQCLYVYDILLVNNQVVTNLPFYQRLERLNSTIPHEVKGRVHFAQRKLASSAKDLSDGLNQAIDNREEGIMIKDPNGTYRPNARGGHGGWLKIKPEYNNELSDSLDLLVLGGYYGSHRGRSGAGNVGNLPVTHFLLGVISAECSSGDSDEKTVDNFNIDNSINQKLFHSFCRVGSGYSNKELFDLLQRLQPHFCQSGKDKKQLQKIFEAGIRLGKSPKPDVWIDPTKSVVLQVKAAEIVRSEVYDVGLTLRFPRVINIRDDKLWSDCTSLQEILRMNSQYAGKLAKRHHISGECEPSERNEIDNMQDNPLDLDLECNSNSNNNKRRAGKRGSPVKKRKIENISSSYRVADTKNIIPTTSALNGKVIVIEPSSNPKYKDLKAKLEKIVVKHGGTVEQNVAAGRTFCYIQTAGTTRAKSVISSGLYDVVQPQWLIDSEKAFRFFGPADMIFTTEATDIDFRKSGLFDNFGDSYIQRATKDSLQYAMKNSQISTCHKIKTDSTKRSMYLDKEIAELETEYLTPNWKLGIFRNVIIYTDKYHQIGKPETEIGTLHKLDLAELIVTFYGGKSVVEDIVQENGIQVTHVVKLSGDQDRLDELKSIRRELPQGAKFRIVNDDWVQECLRTTSLVSETGFEM